MERFFDESGGTQLVIHAPFGSRVNRAWGLALRKRFCRTFNFELQAAATEDAIVLSLTGSHSFALDEVWRYLRSNTAEHVLIQALLDAPLFGVRWRWNATNALALPRYAGGRKVAPQLQRMKSEDLLATMFPGSGRVRRKRGRRARSAAASASRADDRRLSARRDGQRAAGSRLLRRIEGGEVRLVTRDLPAPSPLAAEILIGASLCLPRRCADRRTPHASRADPALDRSASTDDLGALDADAIDGVRDEAWPRRAQRRRNARSADESRLHHRRRSAAQRRLAGVARSAGRIPAARRGCG